ncbi:oxidoreductase [Streptomyces sp. YC504]|uniref:Oxidoreductase n=1 Tax=Streptomyces mesophilus TaxID=1775132 RepID=A0A6G4XMH9_9ACTN|nr:oxidoreductase [Streptomyces mesophilus]NGO78755.1 oxidoreductase [Streptomyces mesophilus]
MNPAPYRVNARWPETPATATVRLDPVGEPLPGFVPGQFARIGGRSLPVSALPTNGGLGVTARRIDGPAYTTRIGDRLELTGPYGSGWQLEKALGHDLLIIAYGIGLATLRPLIRDAVADPRAYGRLNVLIGAPDPSTLMARHETAHWPTALTALTVDCPGPGWYGAAGPVHTLLSRAHFDPGHTTAFLCAPRHLLRATAQQLLRHGLPPDRIVTGSLTDGRPTAPAPIRTWEESDA